VMTGYGPNHVGELEKPPSITSPNFGEATASLLESASTRTK
jgi:hypothetical protein